jgi:ribonucleotide monophosphatase NagD (HAD superfamily)
MIESDVWTGPLGPTNGAGEDLVYLIDMDGVIHRGGRLIPGADRLIGKPREVDLPSRSPTNNSQRSRRDVATWLRLLTHLPALEPIVEEDQ